MSGPTRGRPSARRKGGGRDGSTPPVVPTTPVDEARPDAAPPDAALPEVEVRRASSSPPRPSARASRSRARAEEASEPSKSKRRKKRAEPDSVDAEPTPARAPRAPRGAAAANDESRRPQSSSEAVTDVAGERSDPQADLQSSVATTTSPKRPRSTSRGAGDDDNVLYDIESAVDQMLKDADSIAGDPRARRRAAEAMTALAERLSGYADAAAGAAGSRRPAPAGVIARIAKFAMRHRSEDVDAFGLDPAYEARLRPVLDSLHERWFRVHTRGIENVPASGRVMLVANHGGLLPLDALMVATSLRVEHSAARATRWLAEDFTFHMPFVGSMLTRLGAVRACPENAERVLDEDGALTVFPEGLKGVSKLFQDRYSLQRFGRGGYVKVALRTGAPIVPVGIVGAEEAYPLLLKSDRLARWLGVPLLPVTPLFPWLGPAGLVPLPSRFEIHFGEPIPLGEAREREQDPLSVSRVNELVRGRVQALVESARTERGAAFG